MSITNGRNVNNNPSKLYYTETETNTKINTLIGLDNDLELGTYYTKSEVDGNFLSGNTSIPTITPLTKVEYFIESGNTYTANSSVTNILYIGKSTGNTTFTLPDAYTGTVASGFTLKVSNITTGGVLTVALADSMNEAFLGGGAAFAGVIPAGMCVTFTLLGTLEDSIGYWLVEGINTAS